MMRRFALFILALAGAAKAQTLDCYTSLTQMELTNCAAQAHQAADVELNNAWTDALARAQSMDPFSPENQPLTSEMLREAQRTWIAFRDKACAAESTMARGGSMQNQLFFICLERLTRQRSADLQLFAQGLGR